jgi:hypothetical protein
MSGLHLLQHFSGVWLLTYVSQADMTMVSPSHIISHTEKELGSEAYHRHRVSCWLLLLMMELGMLAVHWDVHPSQNFRVFSSPKWWDHVA